jgi:hypothetical protein
MMETAIPKNSGGLPWRQSNEALIEFFLPIFDFFFRLMILVTSGVGILLFPFILGAAVWLILPGAFKPPIIDFVLNLLILGALVLPDALFGLGPIGPIAKEAIVTFLETLKKGGSPGKEDEAPDGLDFFDVRADDLEVGEDVLDLYQCFTVDAPVDSDKFIRRLEVVVDASEVLHHVVLLRDPEKSAPEGRHECPGMPQNSDYLYAWAPGGGPIQFPDGGLRVSPGERFVLKVHYNNATGVSGVVDTSEIQLYHDEPVGTEYGMIAPGPLALSVAPSATEDVSGTCNISEETTRLAGMPHMHEIGKAFSQEIERADGTMEPVVSLENWEFETQLFYSMSLTMMPGDKLHTTGTFENTSQDFVRSGERTEDEMCFNFMCVTPPPASRYCDSNDDSTPDLVYEPGQRLPEPPIAEPTLATGTFDFGGAPTPTGGEVTPGVYEITSFTIYRETATTPVGDIDAEESLLLARGQLVVNEEEATFDADFSTSAALESGQSFDSTNDIPFGGRGQSQRRR